MEATEVLVPQRLMAALPAGGGWVPIYIELKSSSGKTETVTIEGKVNGQEKRGFVMHETVEVAPGAPTRTCIYLRAAPSDVRQTARIEVRGAGGAIIRRDAWDLSTYGEQEKRLALLVVGENLGDLSPWPGNLQRSDGRFDDLLVTADSCLASQLPDSLLGKRSTPSSCSDAGAARLERSQLSAPGLVYPGRSPARAAARARSSGARRRELFRDALRDPVAEPGFIPGVLRAVDSQRASIRFDARRLDRRRTIVRAPDPPLPRARGRSWPVVCRGRGPSDRGAGSGASTRKHVGRGSVGVHVRRPDVSRCSSRHSRSPSDRRPLRIDSDARGPSTAPGALQSESLGARSTTYRARE